MNFRLISILALGVAAVAAHAVSFTANFDGITAGTALTNQYAAKGLTFTGANVVVGAPSAFSGANVAKVSGTTITGTLSKYANTVSIKFYNTGTKSLTLTTFDATNKKIGLQVSSRKNSWNTISVGPGSKIASFTISGSNNAFSVDDLTVSPVPEPASRAALGVGLLALRRRKKA